jgi:hypothetical protein
VVFASGHARARQLLAGAIALVFMQLQVSLAQGEVHVEGSPQAVRIEARNASQDELLQALGTTFHVRYQTSVALDQRINGNFSGSLAQVIAQVLAGYDYVTRHGSDGVQLKILRLSGKKPVASAPPAKRTNKPPWIK